MATDTWLSDLLARGALADPLVCRELAVALAVEEPAVDRHGTVTRGLLGALGEVWERGWQPADVVHLARRDTPAGAVPLLVALIGEDARRSQAASRAPAAWVEQLTELGVPGGATDPAVVGTWLRAARRPPEEAWRVVLQLWGVLQGAARLETLLPPPSRWGHAPPRRAAAPTAGDDRVLRRIRGLLTKAESTGFPEEAEALTAKAQELMTRYAVDVALLDAARTGPAGGGEVEARRLHVRDPYVRAKMQLLAAVAEANGVRVVWYSSVGLATVVGVRSDVAAAELLFTSLLLQVGQALSAAERRSDRNPASRAFRRSFLLGYAFRIGQRLAEARRRATAAATAEHGADLLPVLRSREAAVEERVAELFPRLRATRARTSVDAGGWYAGREAAERADVGARRDAVRS